MTCNDSWKLAGMPTAQSAQNWTGIRTETAEQIGLIEGTNFLSNYHVFNVHCGTDEAILNLINVKQAWIKWTEIYFDIVNILVVFIQDLGL